MKVIQRSNIPVLAVPDNSVFSNLERIAFTTSFESLYKIDDLLQLKELITLNQSKLYILHAVCEDHFADEISKDIDFFKLNFINPIFKFLHLKDKDIYTAIHKFSTKNDIKMIAMSINKHSFFERLFNRHTFETIAFNSDIPFLVMKNSGG